MTALVATETVVLVLLALLVVGLLRSHAEILRTLHDLGVGPDAELDLTAASASASTYAPAGGDGTPPDRARVAFDVQGVTPSGDAVVVGVHGAPRQVLLAFLSSGCTTCQTFWDALRDGAARHLPGDLRVVVVAAGDDRESASAIAERAPTDVPVVMSSQAWHDYDVPGSPYFVHVDGPSGRIVGDGTARTWPQLVGLVEDALGDRAERDRRIRADRDERTARRRRGGAAREARADAALAAAGIRPGDPSLYGPVADPPDRPVDA
ncbi:MAG TPA: hypothetical protein VIB48_11250 [Acidimicrobiia bacterium]|jgi:hypothetical protein